MNESPYVGPPSVTAKVQKDLVNRLHKEKADREFRKSKLKEKYDLENSNVADISKFEDQKVKNFRD